MADFDHLPYRPCAGLILLNDENKVFVAKRIDMPSDAWQMPQGGIDEGEDAEQAAMRELEEEIGTNKARIISRYPTTLLYDLPDELKGKIWGGRYRGQEMHWFLLRYEGTEQDINLETEHPEFSDYQWVQMEQLPDLAISFKRDVYQRLVDHFITTL